MFDGKADRYRTNVYFESVHKYMPFVHRSRYLADIHLAPQAQPPMCLRYAIWTVASAQCQCHKEHADIFYRRARQYLESDEMKVVFFRILALALTDKQEPSLDHNCARPVLGSHCFLRSKHRDNHTFVDEQPAFCSFGSDAWSSST